MFRESSHRLHKFEHYGPDMHKFVTGYSSSESEYRDSSESDDANGLDERRDSASIGDSVVTTDESLSMEGSGSEADDSDTDVIIPRNHRKEHDPYNVEEDFWYWVDKEKAKGH